MGAPRVSLIIPGDLPRVRLRERFFADTSLFTLDAGLFERRLDSLLRWLGPRLVERRVGLPELLALTLDGALPGPARLAARPRATSSAPESILIPRAQSRCQQTHRDRQAVSGLAVWVTVARGQDLSQPLHGGRELFCGQSELGMSSTCDPRLPDFLHFDIRPWPYGPWARGTPSLVYSVCAAQAIRVQFSSVSCLSSGFEFVFYP